MDRRDFLGTTAGLALTGQTPAADEAPMDETIRRAREAALAVLRPTERQLEHARALHARALVFDAYGFSPTSAVDAAALRDAAAAGASDVELQDLREEMSMTRHVADP